MATKYLQKVKFSQTSPRRTPLPGLPAADFFTTFARYDNGPGPALRLFPMRRIY